MVQPSDQTILHVVFGFPPATHWGGPGAVVELVAQEQAKAGFRVVVASSDRLDRQNSIDNPEDDRSDLSVHRLPMYFFERWPGSVGPALLTARGVRQLDCLVRSADVVHIHGWRHVLVSAAAILSRRHRRPLFIQPHGSIDTYGGKAALKSTFDRSVGARILRWASGTLVITAHEEALAIALGASVKRIPNPSPTREVPALGVRERSNDVVYIGRLHQKKGIDLLLQAWERPHTQRALEGGTLHVLGSDDGVGAGLRQLVDGMESSVKMSGHATPRERDRILADRPIVVVPSRSDIFPMVILEAASFGCPLVITDQVQISAEMTKEAEVCEAEQGAISDALGRVAANRAQAEANSLKIASRYSSHNTAARIVETYREAGALR